MRVEKITEWETPASRIPDGTYGRVQILTDWYEQGQVFNAYCTQGVEYYQTLMPIPIKTLLIDGKTWMVDDPPHQWAMLDHAATYEGDVLVAGLGLGLIIHALRDNPKVNQIVVVEREPDVIRAVGPYVPADRLTIVQGDFWEYEADRKFGGILFDLLVGKGHELFGAAIRHMLVMKEKYPEVPNIRIHGYDNLALNRMVDEAIQARNQLAERDR
jgi:hypothetical protein